jgi:hypothetical protein
MGKKSAKGHVPEVVKENPTESKLELLKQLREVLAKLSHYGGHKRYWKLLFKMVHLCLRKGNDYSGENPPLYNLRSSLRINISPWVGVLIRLQDKMGRAETKACGVEWQVEEDMDELGVDIANYALFMACLFYDFVKDKVKKKRKPSGTTEDCLGLTPKDFEVTEHSFNRGGFIGFEKQRKTRLKGRL